MIAGIRRRRGDELWPELGLSQWRYIRAQGKHFLKASRQSFGGAF